MKRSTNFILKNFIRNTVAVGCLFIAFLASANSTQKYWLDFDPSKVTVSDNLFTLDSLTIEAKSTWLNAVSVYLTQEQKAQLEKYPFILDISMVQELHAEVSNKTQGGYGEYIECLNPEFFEKMGLDGSGVIAGVIDAGFINVDSGSAFKHIVKDKRILGYKDFINPGREDFFKKATSADMHGANVLAYMAGYDTKNKKRIGLATGASFYLARTENGEKEHLVEEDDWVEAIEWMYTKGVKVVNTSLGYSTFDDTTTNHLTTDMDGKTTKITLAAQKASEKGMIIVCSAGNLGHEPWRYISAPADAPGVIAVGATTREEYGRAFYSSIGPEYNDYIKPDVSCYSDRGTSYASPEIAGFVACMLQKYPNLTPQEVKDALFYAGHLNPLPNNNLGYGIPDPQKVFDYLDGMRDIEPEVFRVKGKGKKVKLKFKETLDQNIVVFHKMDEVHVLSDFLITKKKLDKTFFERTFGKKKGVKYRKHIKDDSAKITLFRNEEVKFTTVVVDGKLYEVVWK